MARKIGRTCAWLSVVALLAGACGDDGGGGGSTPDGGAGSSGSAGSGATGGSATGGSGGSSAAGGSSGSATGGSGALGGTSSGGSAGSDLDGGAGSPADGSAGSAGSPADGSAGSGGSGGSPGDAGADSGTSFDCTPFVGVTQSVACASYANAYCTLIDTCSPATLAFIASSVAHCKQRIELLCAQELTAPNSGYQPAAMAAVADALGKLSCADFYATSFDSIGVPGANCGGPGTLATGKQCYANTQCASGECREGDPCGTCTGVGSPCDTTVNCLDEHFCNALHQCEPKKSVGQACSDHEQCLGGWCSGTCQPGKTLGASCNLDEECAQPLICGANKQCKQPARAALGASCAPIETLSCNSDFFLSCDSITQKCELDAFPGPGDVCGLFIEGGEQVFKPFCVNDSTCVFAAGTLTGTCVANAPDGAACNETTGPYCTFLASCVNGVCTVPNATLCPPI